MKRAIALLMFIALASGCATSRDVNLGAVSSLKEIKTAALTPQSGNSEAMDAHVKQQLAQYNITVLPDLPAGSFVSESVDAIVTYSDSWRWDLKMYLFSITIELYDAKTGVLMVRGQWRNSAFHGFQDPKDVIKELMDDMYSKLPQAKR